MIASCKETAKSNQEETLGYNTYDFHSLAIFQVTKTKKSPLKTDAMHTPKAVDHV
jgi:hypothetical protein